MAHCWDHSGEETLAEKSGRKDVLIGGKVKMTFGCQRTTWFTTDVSEECQHQRGNDFPLIHSVLW